MSCLSQVWGTCKEREAWFFCYSCDGKERVDIDRRLNDGVTTSRKRTAVVGYVSYVVSQVNKCNTVERFVCLYPMNGARHNAWH